MQQPRPPCFCSLTVEARRANEQHLLRRYHELLVADGVRDYGIDQLYQDLRLALLRQLGGTTMWLGSVDLGPLVCAPI